MKSGRKHLKNPYTKVAGYILAKRDPLNGWFVAQALPAEDVAPYRGRSWAVTSIKRKQTIYTETKSACLSIMQNGLDGCHLDKWDYEYRRAGEFAVPATQTFLFMEDPGD